VAEDSAEIIKRIMKYFNLCFVGVNPKTDKFLLSKSLIKSHEIAISPITCSTYILILCFSIMSRKKSNIVKNLDILKIKIFGFCFISYIIHENHP